MPDQERVAVLEAKMDAHFRADETGFQRINTDTTEIKSILSEMARKLEESTRRVHDRIDETAHSLNNKISATAAEARSNVNLALASAQDAKDGVKDSKIWALGGLGITAMAVISWFADKFWGGAPHG